MTLETAERRLLNLIQTDFPLVPRPFAELGSRLGEDAVTVMEQIKALKHAGVIRAIGPVVDGRKLGYQSTLVAMIIPRVRLEEAESLIAVHPGVSHGYERDHEFNVWFTLAVPPSVDVDQELARLAALTGAEAAVSLPATRLFKIGAFFDMDESGSGPAVPGKTASLTGTVALSETECRVLRELQQDLPLTDEAFSGVAERLHLPVEGVLAAARSLQESGVIRRFSASINHRRAGFSANAMTCWTVPADKVESVGNALAGLKEVSHCYERATGGRWRHNLFAMVHCRSKEACEEIARNAARETGLTEYELLYSTREFKKARIKYLA